MVTLTEVAAGRIRDIIQDTPDAQGKALRLFVEGGGCAGFSYAFSFDDKKEDDTVITQPGFEVLIDPASAMYLAGASVDFIEGMEGAGFKIENPNAGGGHCGCGKSFST